MSSEKKKRNIKKSNAVTTGIASSEAVLESMERLKRDYNKSEQYTGSRRIYDDASAKIAIKKEAFHSKTQMVKDPYTRKELFLTKKEAKLNYGDKWTEHLAESDHKVPIARVYEDTKNDPWIKNEDIRNAVNQKENMEVVSRKFNNVKRSKTNEELVNNDEYLKGKGLRLSAHGKKKAIQAGQEAQRHIENELIKNKISNIAGSFHEVGKSGAINAAGMTAALSTMTNIVDVIKGAKKPEDALKDVAIDTAEAGAAGYALTGTLSVIGHSLENSSSEFIQALVKSNAPAKVLTAVMATGDILCKYAKGEISSSECIVQIGERGTAAVVTGYAMGVGQAVIPIPLVGAAVGALVGTAISGTIYSSIQKALDDAKSSEEEYRRVKAAADEAIARMEANRQEFIRATDQLFADRAVSIQNGLMKVAEATSNNNFDDLTRGLNEILSSFGRSLKHGTFDEYDAFMSDKSTVEEL